MQAVGVHKCSYRLAWPVRSGNCLFQINSKYAVRRDMMFRPHDLLNNKFRRRLVHEPSVRRPCSLYSTEEYLELLEYST